jgi:hypothetical protein
VRSFADQPELEIQSARKFRRRDPRGGLTGLPQGHFDPRQSLERHEGVAVKWGPGEAGRHGIGVEHTGGRHLEKAGAAQVAERRFSPRGSAECQQHTQDKNAQGENGPPETTNIRQYE